MSWKNFQRPKVLMANDKANSATVGEFFAEPFERGFGTTIGNALRRTLLSGIEGAAITAIRIKGASHEFSSLPGVVEDTTDIILNLKQIPLAIHTDGPVTVTLSAKGKGVVKAGQIETTSGVDVLDEDCHIATLNSEGSLEIEIIVSRGRGYTPAEENFDETYPIGFIPLDSSYSPIRKVSYTVEGTRVGQATDYEKLALKVWTNGAVTPVDALSRAAVLLKDHAGIFINFEEEPSFIGKPGEYLNEGAALENLGRLIDELEISSTRAKKALEGLEIRTISDLVTRSEEELMALPNFGKKSLEEIKEKLSTMGLSLGMQIDDFETKAVL